MTSFQDNSRPSLTFYQICRNFHDCGGQHATNITEEFSTIKPIGYSIIMKLILQKTGKTKIHGWKILNLGWQKNHNDDLELLKYMQLQSINQSVDQSADPSILLFLPHTFYIDFINIIIFFWSSFAKKLN